MAYPCNLYDRNGKKITFDEVKKLILDNYDNIKANKEGMPLVETKGEGGNVSGVKKEISTKQRESIGLPKVDFPKMGKDYDLLNAAKERVDSGEVNPQNIVDRILKENSTYKNENEVYEMQYYSYQLQKKLSDITNELSKVKNEDKADLLRNQRMQLSDVIDNATRAELMASNKWGKIGGSMQPVIDDEGKIFRVNKIAISDAYNGKVPKEVQKKIDDLTKERDNALEAKSKLEQTIKEKMAERGFEEIKKSALKQSKIKQTKEQLQKEASDLVEQLKKEWKKPNDTLQSTILPIKITDKMVTLIGKLAINYAKQGIKEIELLVEKIYSDLEGNKIGISKQDIRDMIVQYNEIKKLNKKAETITKKVENPLTDFELQLKNKRKFITEYNKSNEWVKARQRVVDAEYKMKKLKREAFESQKNMYQKSLMWAARISKIFVLSGYTPLIKLSSAATIGGLAVRPIEQGIGSIYSKLFKGISEKAPLEGFTNAKSEAKFYKEFFNPVKFSKNAIEILKTGSTSLNKRLGDKEYEHIIGLYLPTDLHQIIKEPLKRATFESSFLNGLVYAEKNGLDTTDPLIINSIENAAYKKANYAIFQENNKLSNAFNNFKSYLEKKGNTGATAKFLAEFLIPVSVSPTNIVKRLIGTSSPLGLIRGSKGVIDAYRKGIEKLTNEEADKVMLQLKKGTLGTALWLIGWYGASQFGGLYSKFNPNKKRDEGQLTSDEMMVGGEMIPKPVQHAWPLETIQLAATARHIYDKYSKDGSQIPSALYHAGMGSIGALIEQVPVLETPAHIISSTSSPYEAEKLKEDIKNRLVPQLVRQLNEKPKEFKSELGIKIYNPSEKTFRRATSEDMKAVSDKKDELVKKYNDDFKEGKIPVYYNRYKELTFTAKDADESQGNVDINDLNLAQKKFIKNHIERMADEESKKEIKLNEGETL